MRIFSSSTPIQLSRCLIHPIGAVSPEQNSLKEPGLDYKAATTASITPKTPPRDPALTAAAPVAMAVLLAVAVPAVKVPLDPDPDPDPLPDPVPVAPGAKVVSVGRPAAPFPPLAVAIDALDAAISILLKPESAGLPRSAVPVAEAADPVADEAPETMDEEVVLLEVLLLYQKVSQWSH